MRGVILVRMCMKNQWSAPSAPVPIAFSEDLYYRIAEWARAWQAGHNARRPPGGAGKAAPPTFS